MLAQSQIFICRLKVVWVLWHINLCKLFDTKSIFIQIIRSISNNSVYHTKTVLFQTVQFSISTVLLSKTFLFQAI